MPEYAVLPEGWVETKYNTDDADEYSAQWAHEDHEIVVSVERSMDADGSVSFPITVEQRVGMDGIYTIVSSHAKIADSGKEAERMAAEFMRGVRDGQYVLRTMDVRKWQGNYNFYCISDSEVPEGITADELIDALDEEAYDDDIEDLPEDFDPQDQADLTVSVDVFLRHESEIESTDD